MSILISYQPEGYGESLFIDIQLSESYEETINAACDMWSHHLPPENRIASRRLARQAKRANGDLVWVALQPQRFTEVVRNAGQDILELRLQIECVSLPPSPMDDRRSGGRSPSTLEIPPPASLSMHGNNFGHHGDLAESPRPIIMPLTPQSVFDTMPRSEHGHRSPTSPAGPSATDPKPTNASAFDNGITAFLAGRHEEARAQFQQATNESHQRGDVRQEADCLRHLGTTCRHLGDFVAARSHLANARTMYESLGPDHRQEQLRCDRHLARVEADSGNKQGALVAYQELMRVTEREGLVTQYAWCSYYLGHLFNRMKLYPEALNILKDVVKISREIQNHEIEGFATEESGYTAERQGHLQLAMDCYQMAFGIFREHGEGKWIENENRVKKRMDLLKSGYPALFNTKATKRRWSIGPRRSNRTPTD